MKTDTRLPLTHRVLVMAIVVCFFISGGVALVYQTLWVRMLTIVFGNTSYAVSTVLCAFMAGLGLGSWYFGKKIDDHPRKSLLLYGALEIGIALSALALPYALGATDAIHTLLYKHLVGSNAALALVRFALAFVILIIPTTLMGGTLPVVVRFFVRRLEKLGSGVGTLYFANTFGAVVGCFLTGFYLIGILGVSRTMTWNICANLSIGLIALALYSFLDRVSSAELTTVAADSPEVDIKSSGMEEKKLHRTLRIVLWCAALAGMASLAYEVFWTRVLVFYMNNSVYAFSSMLTTLLLGIAVGGYLFGKIADRQKNLWVWLAGFELVIGLWAIFAFPVFDAVFHRLGSLSRLFEANFWGVPVYVTMAKSAMLMLVPTLLMGAAFPLLSKLYARNMKRLGGSIGNIYSKNTLGSMAGAFAAGFVLIPLFGIQKGVIVVAAVNIGLALAAVWMSGVSVVRRNVLVASIAAAALLSVVIAPKEIFFRRQDERWSKLLFYEEDNTATVKVYELPDEKKSISINGYEVAGARVSLHEIQKALGHYPVLLHADPKTVLIVGFGAGGTSWAISQYGLDRIDLVEIVPAVLKAASYLDEVNHGVLNAPNFHAIIDDGRNYVHATEKTYDVITVDSIDPKHAGNGNLYAVEFYEDCLSKLNPGGIMAEWIPYHLLSERELKIILKSFAHVFPDCQLWFTPLYNYFILVGSPDEIVIDYARLVEDLSNPKVAEDLREIGMPGPVEFVNTFAMDKTGIENYVCDTAEINTYDQPRIEFFGKYDYAAFGQLPIDAPAGRPLLVNLGKTGEQKRAVRHSVDSYNMIARGLIKASYLFRREEYIAAARQWKRTLAADPDNPAAHYMLGVTQKTVEQEWNQRLARLRENPNNHAGYFDMATFCEKIQNPGVAIEMYRKAIELKPDFEPAYNNLGLIYGERGQYDAALDVFEAAREINPRSLVSAYNTVVVYYLKGDYKKAELICREALTYPASAQDEELRTRIRRILRIVEQTRLSANIQ